MENSRNCFLLQEISTLSAKIKTLENEIATIIEENVILKVRLEDVELELSNLKSKSNVDTMDNCSSVLLATPRGDEEECENTELKNRRSFVVGPVYGAYPPWSYKTP